MQNLQEFKDQYENTKLTEEDIANIKNGILFDDSSMYTNNINPTKSSHVDDYINNTTDGKSENGVENVNGKQNGHGENDTQLESNYIPEKINQGLGESWGFLVLKRKQSLYESTLLNHLDDPFHIKELESKKELENNTNEKTFRTPFKTPSKTPLKTPLKSLTDSQENPSNNVSASSKHVLSLSHSLILQRIEADRERQKRGKETLWEVERENNKICLAEFKNIFNTLPSYNATDDLPSIDEMDKLYKLCTCNDELPVNVKYDVPTGPKPQNQTSARDLSLEKKRQTYKPSQTQQRLMQAQQQRQQQQQEQDQNGRRSRQPKKSQQSQYSERYYQNDINDAHYDANRRFYGNSWYDESQNNTSYHDDYSNDYSYPQERGHDQKRHKTNYNGKSNSNRHNSKRRR